MAAKRYWKSFAERDGDPSFLLAVEDEFHESPLATPDLAVDRRSVLKGFAAVFASVALGGCTRGTVHRAVPLLQQQETVVAGRPTFYATTCGGCPAGCGVLAKCRDGRPIKLEGLPGHPISKGGLCAVGQAQVLSLYDPDRLRGPRGAGRPVNWKDLDETVGKDLDEYRKQGAVRVLMATTASATVSAAVDRFLARFADGKRVTYDPLSAAAILDAHARTHGRRVLPRYRFERARAVASFDADFLGTWISPVEFTAGYRAARSPAEPGRFSKHFQLEARLSLTGGNADERFRLAPADTGLAIAHLAAKLAKLAGLEVDLGSLGEPPIDDAVLGRIAAALWAVKGEALVVCGANDPDAQTLVNLANHLLGAYGKTVEIDAPSRQLAGSDHAVDDLVNEMMAGKVAALLVHGVNPAYDLPDAKSFSAAVASVGLTVSFATHMDETARLCRFVCPVPHFLESWGESEPVAGTLCLSQPAIAPLWDTRPFVESLERFGGGSDAELDLVKKTLEEVQLPRQTGESELVPFLNAALHEGWVALPPAKAEPATFDRAKVAKAHRRAPLGPGMLAAVLYPKVGIRDGRHASNPWLQELPDPITKVVWDNYATLSPPTAAKLGVETGQVVRVSWGPVTLELPVVVQPGQHDGVVAIPLGYGRVGTERFAKVGPQWLESRPTTGPNGLVGVNASPLLVLVSDCTSYAGLPVKVEALDRKLDLALTQDHHSVKMPRELVDLAHERSDVVKTLSLKALAAAAGARVREGGEKGEAPPTPGGETPKGGHEAGEKGEPDLWRDDFGGKGPRWGLAIDLGACTGCGACTVSCQAENNVPVVGKDEVRRHREMSWLRIDRYYAGEGDETEVVHQPLMCHHCGHAPCESVCPALATVHSKDGVNEMIYNRCVGTRYCANNCPYKVRRFNWFTYAHDDPVERLVLNPELTVRTRGVMEKCSLCHFRIQDARNDAKRRGVPLADGDVKTACQQSCPAQAITFGDWNDPASELAKKGQDPRFYHLLGVLNTRPGVGYLARVRNVEEKGERHG